jgi:MFS family permease
MKKNILIYYSTEFLGALTFGLPISTFFFTLHLGFNMGWAIFITALTGLTSFLFEVPTGSWADRFGRKRMYIAGLIIGIFGLSFYLWATTIPLFILASIIIGFSGAIMSGNIEAILHDNLSERGEGSGYKEIQANGYTFFFSGRVVACLTG